MPRAGDTHSCPAGCGAQVPQHLYACRVDWYRLPPEIRNRIWAAYRGGMAGEHMNAMTAAAVWYEDNPRSGGRQPQVGDTEVTG